jgi:hypothetical protein
MLLMPEVLSLQILNGLFLIFATVAFVLSIKIYKNWNLNATTCTQYLIEKQSYLAATIIKYIFVLKLPIFLFFIFTLDKISVKLIGAMCGAGVVGATSYGLYLFILKIVNIYIFGLWLLFHSMDIKKEHLPYTKRKFFIFIFIYFILLVEIIVEFLMFYTIDLKMLVSCCGSIYSNKNSGFLFAILSAKELVLLTLFYAIFLIQLTFLFINYKQYAKSLFFIINILFFMLSIISLISFFGTYIYELPTHHCPFCFLQSDYNYIGYLLYLLLFMGTFFGASLLIDEENNRYYKLSIIFNFLYLLVVSYYPVAYYIKNGTWL